MAVRCNRQGRSPARAHAHASIRHAAGCSGERWLYLRKPPRRWPGSWDQPGFLRPGLPGRPFRNVAHRLARHGGYYGQGTEAQRSGAEEAESFQSHDRRAVLTVPAEASADSFGQGPGKAASRAQVVTGTSSKPPSRMIASSGDSDGGAAPPERTSAVPRVPASPGPRPHRGRNRADLLAQAHALFAPAPATDSEAAPSGSTSYPARGRPDTP